MKILVTAGTVYGRLDDNKLVGNRVRGIWATRFAHELNRLGHEVVLLVADIQEQAIRDQLQALRTLPEPTGSLAPRTLPPFLTVVTHDGFFSYQRQCIELASSCQGAVMAAAVVNWIPEKPFAGKMPTAGVGHRMDVPFILAPRVIDDMKKVNPKLALIGCKMTIGATEDELILAAYKTLLDARCNAVVANDMKSGLRKKLIVHQDRVVRYHAVSEPEFSSWLEGLLTDEHFRTQRRKPETWISYPGMLDATRFFDKVVDKYRSRFTRRLPDGDFVFGALAVPAGDGMLCSPREKGTQFTSETATFVAQVHEGTRQVDVCGPKASLNAPLLWRHLHKYPSAAVLHLHERIQNVPTVEYAPPGTVRDNLRYIPGPVYNIAGHGCIVSLDTNGDFV